MPNRNKEINNKRNILPYSYIWTKGNPIAFTTEMYQKFLANLEYVNVDKKLKVIQVTSSISGEGKSTFLSNVAYLLSKKGLKTILVDVDLRKPKVHRIYDVENNSGLTDVLAERETLEKAIKKEKKLGFDVLTSGEKTTAVTNLIESKKMLNLIEKLKSEYDYVLIDSPPVINVADALYISKFTDAVVFIVSQKITKKSVALEAIKILNLNQVNIIGTVLTQVDLRNNRYGYSYGYGYDYYNEDD